ncbi:pectate lyase A-like [Bradysia coprophila]|uniref:pectate lyase A-like n=1 Tax=Bradysia coprophila TaxID=38358 RepID=UPI00187D9D1E|nr:pectate lyase A-like [Bradysia coprophila]
MNNRILLSFYLLAISIQLVNSQDGFASVGEGTTGGAGGNTVDVCTEDELTTAIIDDTPRIVRVVCNITLEHRLFVGSNKSILGRTAGAGIAFQGLRIHSKKNVIIRGLQFCCAFDPSDGVTVENSTNVWIDHNEFYSDMDHHEDYYDGLVDVIMGSDFVTISWNQFRNHWKTSLVGSSDSRGDVDIGRLHVTYHHNYFQNCNSRMPSLRFGTGHIYNNFYENIVEYAINSRMGAQVLVEGNVFRNATLAITTSLYSIEEGYAVERNNDFGGSNNNITQVGTFTNPPYSYRIDRTSKIPYLVRQHSGQTILF